jgi:hypothetical protein
MSLHDRIIVESKASSPRDWENYLHHATRMLNNANRGFAPEKNREAAKKELTKLRDGVDAFLKTL